MQLRATIRLALSALRELKSTTRWVPAGLRLSLELAILARRGRPRLAAGQGLPAGSPVAATRAPLRQTARRPGPRMQRARTGPYRFPESLGEQNVPNFASTTRQTASPPQRQRCS